MRRARQLQDVSKNPKDLRLFSALAAPPSGCLRSQFKQTPTQRSWAAIYPQPLSPPPTYLLPGSAKGTMLWPADTACGNSGPTYKQLIPLPAKTCAKNKAAFSYNKLCCACYVLG